MLSIENLTVQFGGFTLLDEISFGSFSIALQMKYHSFSIRMKEWL